MADNNAFLKNGKEEVQNLDCLDGMKGGLLPSSGTEWAHMNLGTSISFEIILGPVRHMKRKRDEDGAELPSKLVVHDDL